jgi:hypothetical protein
LHHRGELVVAPPPAIFGGAIESVALVIFLVGLLSLARAVWWARS